MAIKLISFDLDDTLWDNHRVLARAEAEVESVFRTYCPEVLEKYSMAEIAAHRQSLMQQPQWQHQISAVRLHSYQQLLAEFMPAEQALGVAGRAFYRFMQLRNCVNLFDDCEKLLASLSQCYPLVALTNGNVDLEAVGLSQYFSGFYSAEMLNSSKPAAAHFAAALKQFGCLPAEVLHIGDHPRDDIWAAQQQGFQTLWFNNKGLDWRQLPDYQWQGQKLSLTQRPDFEVGQLQQIIDLLS